MQVLNHVWMPNVITSATKLLLVLYVPAEKVFDYSMTVALAKVSNSIQLTPGSVLLSAIFSKSKMIDKQPFLLKQ